MALQCPHSSQGAQNNTFLLRSLFCLGCEDFFSATDCWLYVTLIATDLVLPMNSFKSVPPSVWADTHTHLDTLYLKHMNNAGLRLYVSDEGAEVTYRCPSLLPSVMWNKRPRSSMFCSGKITFTGSDEVLRQALSVVAAARWGQRLSLQLKRRWNWKVQK